MPAHKLPVNDTLALSGARVGIVIKSKHGNRLGIVDASDYVLVSDTRWNLQVDGYTAYAVKAGELMHRRLIEVKAGLVVDHIDRDGLNNTRGNLRVTTQRENIVNRRVQRNNTSGYRGVSKQDGRWKAMLGVRGKHVYLGLFNTPEDAARAYNKAVLEHNEPGSPLNEIGV